MAKDYSHIKILIVGASPFEPKMDNYRNLKYREVLNFMESGVKPSIEKNNCIPANKYQKARFNDNKLKQRLELFDDVAFIPLTKNSYSEWKVTSYVRMLSFITYAFITNDSKKFPLNNPKEQLVKENANILEIISSLVKQGIYLVNKTELENKNLVEKIKEQPNIIFICFGNIASDFIKTKIMNTDDKYKKFSNIIEYPHPSGIVHHPLWRKLITSKRQHDKLDQVKKLYAKINTYNEELMQAK